MNSFENKPDPIMVENLTKIYGSGNTEVVAMKDVTLRLASGEVIALLGPSGAGKSTLLTAIGLINPPAAGRIYIGYDVHDHKAWAARPYDCMVGCTTCANICPAQAITFPDRQLVQKIEREHKILAIVRQEAAAKHAKLDAEKFRAQAEDAVASAVSRVAFHIAGEFGEKRFLAKLGELIKDRPFDVVNLKLEVPTLKGALEKTPSHMNFEVSSTDQQDIGGFLTEVRSLIRENQLVLANENRV